MRLRRWYCSPASFPSRSKKVSKRSEAAKEKRTMAVKSFVQRYMLTYPGVFPKPTEVRGAVGGSWHILKEILAEMKAEMLPASQIDQQTASTSLVADAYVTKEVEGNTGSSTVNVRERGFVTLFELLNEVEDPSVLASVESSDDFELLQPKKRQETMEDFTTSGSVANQPLFHSINQNAGAEKRKEKTTVTTVTNRHSFKAKPFDDASSPCTSEDYARRVGAMASKHDFLLLDQRTSELDKTSPRNLPRLVELFTRRVEKIRFDCPNDNTLKKVIPVNFREEGSGSLENSKKHSNLSYMFTGKILKQDEYLKHKKLHSEESKMRLGVKGLLNHSTELTRDTPKTGPWANESSNNIKLLSKEASPGISVASIVQMFKHLGLNDQHTSGSQLEKKQGNKPYEVIESEENEDENCPKLETLLSDKDKQAMDTSDGLNSLLISDESDSDISAFEYPSPEPNNEVPSSTKGFHLNTNLNDRKLTLNYRLLVYFLPKTVKVKDLIQTFGDSGPISEIQILPSRENRFNYAHIFFKTEEGLRNALSKTDVAVGGADVATEVAVAPSAICDRMLCIEQVNNADFPDHFLKYPNRTVIINGLPDNLSFHHLKCALSTWGRITGIAMGTSVSTVFIEFESEKSKEKSLAEAAISISGTTLYILRVDAPKTTIIRISNVNPVSGATKVHLICDSFGRVKRVAGRCSDTFDVHFKLSEWPNMLKIINGLNGLVVDQHRWIAQPATLIPVEILQALWNKPKGRKQVHELIRNLCGRISDESIDTSPLLALAEEY